jgi:hypothetical protein
MAFHVVPWAWLLCFAVFVSAVTYKVGHFPSYSNPDPKHVAGLGTLYTATVLLLLATFLSPLVVGAHMGLALLGRSIARVTPWNTIVYLLGVTLTGAVILGDAFGLGNWLFD